MHKLLAANADLRQRLQCEAAAVAAAYNLPTPPAPEIAPVSWQAARDEAEQRTGTHFRKFFNPTFVWGQS